MAVKKKAAPTRKPAKPAANKATTTKKAGAKPVKAKSVASDMKTKPTATSVEAFIAAVPNEARREDAKALLAMFKKVTGEKAVMWGPSIVGFGRYHYKYESGREGDMCMTGFSPRAAASVLYVMPGFKDIAPKLAKLGKHKTGGSCLYINKLADVDMKVLEGIVAGAWKRMKAKYKS